MINKELYVGIDEFTLVLQSNSSFNYEEWNEEAYFMVREFLLLSKLEMIFGRVLFTSTNLPAGYTSGWMFNDFPFYFAIAVNASFPRMGVIVKFSAHAWSEYCKRYDDKYSESMTINKFLQNTHSALYSERISRIDMYADYFNYLDFTVSSIYEQLKNSSYIIQDCKGKVTRRKISAVEQDFGAETLYIGSKKNNTKCLMRIYNKKLEQQNRSGYRLQEALSNDSWVRFEVSYRGEYAHIITDDLFDITTEMELSKYIATKITDKYRFVESNEDNNEKFCSFTKELLDASDSTLYPALKSVRPRDNSLYESVQHIICGSGLFPLLYKIGQIWGVDKEVEFLELLYSHFNDVYRSKAQLDKKINLWLKKHTTTLSKQQFLESIYVDTESLSEE